MRATPDAELVQKLFLPYCIEQFGTNLHARVMRPQNLQVVGDLPWRKVFQVRSGHPTRISLQVTMTRPFCRVARIRERLCNILIHVVQELEHEHPLVTDVLFFFVAQNAHLQGTLSSWLLPPVKVSRTDSCRDRATAAKRDCAPYAPIVSNAVILCMYLCLAA